MSGVPYWRLSGFYLFYFAVVGIVSPFWGLYLDHLGFKPEQIGALVAMPMVTRIVAPNVWGWLSDRTGRYLWVIRAGAVGAVLGFVGILFRTDYGSLLFFTALFTFFWNAILPQFEVVTLDALGSRAHEYSRVRLWGSLGFIISVVGLGAFFDAWSITWLPWILWVCLVGIAAATFSIPSSVQVEQPLFKISMWPIVRQPQTLSFLIAALLMHLSHGVYYGFFSLYLAQHGYSSTAIGLLWALGVVAEIVIFLNMPRLLSRFSLRHCYLACLLAAGLRWAVIGAFPEQLGWLLGAQLLHAMTFGVAHAVAIEWVRMRFGLVNRGKGQALYSAFCFGGGGAVGAYISGWVWSFSPAACFGFAAVAALLGWLVAYWGMGDPKGDGGAVEDRPNLSARV